MLKIPYSVNDSTKIFSYWAISTNVETIASLVLNDFRDV
jgi:hypothetical protein